MNSTGQRMTPTLGIPISWIAAVLNALATNGLPMRGAPSQLTDTVCGPTDRQTDRQTQHNNTLPASAQTQLLRFVYNKTKQWSCRKSNSNICDQECQRLNILCMMRTLKYCLKPCSHHGTKEPFTLRAICAYLRVV